MQVRLPRQQMRASYLPPGTPYMSRLPESAHLYIQGSRSIFHEWIRCFREYAVTSRFIIILGRKVKLDVLNELRMDYAAILKSTQYPEDDNILRRASSPMPSYRNPMEYVRIRELFIEQGSREKLIHDVPQGFSLNVCLVLWCLDCMHRKGPRFSPSMMMDLQ